MTQVTSKLVDEATRIAVGYDEDAQNPLMDWCHGTSVAVFAGSGISNAAIESHGDQTHHEQLAILHEANPIPDEFEDAVTRYFESLDVPFIIRKYGWNYLAVWYADSHPLRYGGGTCHDEATTKEQVEGAADDYDAYLAGEVYVAHKQKKCEYGDWHTVESIGLGVIRNATDEDLIEDAQDSLGL